jgi:hypothetical protein
MQWTRSVVRGSGSAQDSTATIPAARSSSKQRARNQLSPFPGTESSSTRRPSVTASRMVSDGNTARCAAIDAGGPNSATPTRSPRQCRPKRCAVELALAE